MRSAMEESVGFGPRARGGEPVRLAMQDLHLTGKVLPFGARLMVRHVFVSAEEKPIEVIYAFALPRDAALRRFHIKGEGFSVASDLRPVEEAEREYERGIEAGSLSSFSRIYEDGAVNLSIGNIRPGETVAVQLELVAGVDTRDDGFRFRFPFTLAPGYHPKAHMVEVEPGMGEIELPQEFGDLILPRWSADMEGLHRVYFDLELPAKSVEVASPSHRIRVRQEKDGPTRVWLATKDDLPNRDLVLDVQTKVDGPASFVGRDSKGDVRFAALLPSTMFGKREEGPRRVVFVIDRSGSMDGEPMRQALAAVKACLGALSPEDHFGIVSFDSSVETAAPALLNGDAKGRSNAEKFLGTVDARGGTELVEGIEAAARLLGSEGGGDILLVTDGQVMGTDRIIARVKEVGARIHCLGIGSASQDRFLALLARETGGTESFLTARERVDMAALELFASMARPVAADVVCEVSGAAKGTITPEPARTVYAGRPFLVYGSYKSGNAALLRVTWADGSFDVPLIITTDDIGETVRLLQGARLITDAEAQLAPGRKTRAVAERTQSRIERHLENLSREYGLASRRMALVAVVKREGDVSGALPEIQVVPVGMPEDTRFPAYFDRDMAYDRDIRGGRACRALDFSPPPVAERSTENLCRRLGKLRSGISHARRAPLHKDSLGPEDRLVHFAGALEADGGMPGKTPRKRLQASAFVLAVFLLEGHTRKRGPFSAHVKRLVEFLQHQDLSQLAPEHAAILTRLIEAGETGNVTADKSDPFFEEGDPNKVTAAKLWRRLHKLFDAED
ncbi:MAG: VWA domain-containing protein [Candidatus Hydrogenedentes bacterium]|nr:VWA domain-containing protein [Candidatus Hydrogenedentota bacterium]